MSEKPILFNTEMVRAILDGRKSCTRRIIKQDVDAMLNSPFHKGHPEVTDAQIINKLCHASYQIGDILYVRETWSEWEDGYVYKAWNEPFPQPGEFPAMKWHPSIHMPKAAARIWLRVTNVKVERLQEITEDGSESEGAIDSRGFILSPDNEYNRMHTAREHFAEIWNSTIRGSDLDRYGWDANPWVWVIEFERCEKPGKENSNG